MKPRLSNIELLRIVSIFLVLVAHCNSWLGGGLPDFSSDMPFSTIMRYFVAGLASICVVVFVLISGYFSIKPTIKTIITLWTQILFIKLIAYALDIIFKVGIGEDGFNLLTFIKRFFVFSKGNWFVISYLMLMLFAPALNLFSKSINQKYFKFFLGVFTIAASIWGCLIPSKFAGFNMGYSPIGFAYVYMIGRYIGLNRNNKFFKLPKYYYLLLYVILSIIIGFMTGTGIKWSLYYCNPILISSAISLLLFFSNWNIKENKTINWIAKSVFAVFIFHTTPPIVDWLKEYNIFALNNYPYLKYATIMFGVLLGIFIVAILIDKLRLAIFKPLIDYVSKININFDNNNK